MLTFNLNKIYLPPKARILDVGCGEGRHIFGSLHAYADVYCIGIDQDIPSLIKCKEAYFQNSNTSNIQNSKSSSKIQIHLLSTQNGPFTY